MIAVGARWRDDCGAMTTNLCPACGPVEGELSSRYCMHHLKELLARCLEIPAAERRPTQPDPMDWLEPVFGTRRAA
jgi:hypothetical protein